MVGVCYRARECGCIARYGPYANNVVFDLTAAALKKYPPPPGFVSKSVTEKNLSNTVYTGSDADTKLPGFGEPLTCFRHGDVYPSGNLESDPHNGTHVQARTLFSSLPAFLEFAGA